MAKMDQDKTCHLNHAADMVRGLTDGLLKMEQVQACRGFVTAANLGNIVRCLNNSGSSQKANSSLLAGEQSENQWTVRVQYHGSEDEVEIETARLILCTGSHPTNLPVPIPGLDIHQLDLDTVLKPSELVNILPANTPITVAVVGASHSAILALMNFVTLAQESYPHLRVKWFTRHPLRYAEFMDGWILRDNTGLKGQAADFARTQLEDDKLPTSAAGQVVTKIDCGGGQARELEQYHQHLPDCSHIVQAVGFTRDPLPQLSKNDTPLNMEFDHETGKFYERDDGSVILGLYGAGIAFPERVVDPYGNVEYAVGFFKFMKFLKKVCPTWTAA